VIFRGTSCRCEWALNAHIGVVPTLKAHPQRLFRHVSGGARADLMWRAAGITQEAFGFQKCITMATMAGAEVISSWSIWPWAARRMLLTSAAPWQKCICPNPWPRRLKRVYSLICTHSKIFRMAYYGLMYKLPHIGKFGFDCDNTIGGTSQPNDWVSDWPTFFRQYRIGHQVLLPPPSCPPLTPSPPCLTESLHGCMRDPYFPSLKW